MIRNFISNASFQDLGAKQDVPANMAEFCKDWFVEFEKGCEFEVGPAAFAPDAAGIRINNRKISGWFRIWQTISFDNLELFRTASLGIVARRPSNAESSLKLEWAALLRVGAGGKRVFAKKLIASPKVFGSDLEEVVSEVSLDSLSSGISYIFALQFLGELGSIEIASVRLSFDKFVQASVRPGALPAAKISRSQAVVPSAAVGVASVSSGARPREESKSDKLKADAGLVKLDGNRLIGWADLPTKEDDVLIVVDGQILGAAKPGGLPDVDVKGHEKLRENGFVIEIPDSLLDGTSRSVSLRNGTTGQRIGGQGAKNFDFLSPSASLLVRRQSSADVSKLPIVKSDVSDTVIDASARRRKVAVVSWDMAHNPVGRAFLLADMSARKSDVELVGPMFPMYGTKIWPPIAAFSMPMDAFPAASLRDLVIGAKKIAGRIKCDVVHVGKARFSSLLIGALIKQANRCPMVIDVDDHELSFFPNRTQATLDELSAAVRADPSIRDKPFVEIWTRYAESLVAAADGVTVSNYALQHRFGGLVVRHGRDEAIFDPKRYDRNAIRAEFGYGAHDRVVLFLGTPRPHKGVFEIAEAMEKINDDRLALCVIGTIHDKRVSSRFSAYKRARISLNPDQPWSRLPELVNMADAVFLIQDEKSAISEYQIPAKLTDALAMDVPVYATPVPPLIDLIAAGAVRSVPDDASLEQELRRLVADRIESPVPLSRSRDYYLTELSYAVNASRIEAAFEAASAATSFNALQFDEMFAFLEKETGVELPRFSRVFKAPAIWKATPPDMVFLWKQNDSDIYGRRHDMMAKYLLKSKAVRRIIHFDAPISAENLERQARHGTDAIAHQGNDVYLNTIRRALRQADSRTLLRRTFLHRSGKIPERYLGADLPPYDAYGDFVQASLREAGISQAPILWVCPVVFDYPQIRSIVGPECVIADIIDDQRRWPAREAYKQRIVKSYEEVLADADVVLANCEPVKHGFMRQRSDITVIPNGAEVFDLSETWAVPDEMSDLARPILGYVGNLRDRVDLVLIEKVADANPSASVVLIGSAHDRPDVLALAKRPNVHFLGVRPYNQAVRFIRAFDIAMVPHLHNELSENMNPLKLYVYFGLNVPVVTTNIANIGDIAPFATVTSSHEGFLQGITNVLAGKNQQPDYAQRLRVLDHVSWEARVGQVLSQLGISKRSIEDK